jgi:5'-deoxynucleotidase
MSSHFYAMLSRMKNINRWGLMRNTRSENLSEHSLEVAFIAHCLAIISNKRFSGNVDADRAAVVAMFHDTSEIITGDLPTPIKYYNPEIKDAYKKIEVIAEDELISLLPEDLREEFESIYHPNDEKLLKIVKAADKISALIKCIEELNMGNIEFKSAHEATVKALDNMNMPEIQVFLDEFIDSFYLSLDEQRR